MIAVVEKNKNELGIQAICDAMSIPRSNYYRYQARELYPVLKIKKESPRALTDGEKQKILAILHSSEYVDKAPLEIYGSLLDQDQYLCSVSTMYRILRSQVEVRERRKQYNHPNYKKPELLATGPNQLWSWDITQLKGPYKGAYFYLYEMLDVYSRFVVGWLVAEHQTADHAQRLLRESCKKHSVTQEQLIIHSDNGKQMKAKNVSQLLASLGVNQSFSRPYVSNDNPYSESGFKTLKYHSDFPERFGSLEDALRFCRFFFDWYNKEHHHTGLNLFTPEQVHYGYADSILIQRQIILNEAFKLHPERFVKGCPIHPPLPDAVWINEPKKIIDKKEV